MPVPAGPLLGSLTLYCTMDDLKSSLGMSLSDTASDAEMEGAVDAASRAIDDLCDRVFYQVTATRTFVACDWWRCDIDDLVSVTTLATDSGGDGTFENTWSASDYQLLPVNTSRWADQRPYTSIKAVGSQTFPLPISGIAARSDRVQVAGVFGWPAVPGPIRRAAVLVAADLFRSKDAPFGIAGGGDFIARVRANGTVMSLIKPYRRYAVLVA